MYSKQSVKSQHVIDNDIDDVIVVAKTPSITSQKCEMNNESLVMECIFHTNTDSRDLVGWQISFTNQ